jgi:dATP pyrophosphohydrolase
MPEVVSRLIEVFVFRETSGSREYLILRRSPDEIYPGIWSVCAGSIEQNEKTYEAALRELEEETSLKPARLFLVDAVNSFYDVYDDVMHVIPLFVAEVKDDSVKLSDEHSDYVWKELHEAKKILHWVSHKNNIELIDKCLTEEEYFKTLKLIS